jgi:hypothetical protein
MTARHTLLSDLHEWYQMLSGCPSSETRGRVESEGREVKWRVIGRTGKRAPFGVCPAFCTFASCRDDTRDANLNIG